MKTTSWVQELLSWFDANKRSMPWRGHPDPYAVWVSEIMLQQTQVDTVRPFFTRFLKAFPTIKSLAEAADEPLLKAWEGLGYYTRVRNLRFAAQQVLQSFDGQLPHSVEDLRSLKGIGAYSAAAIASICFNVPEPVVDGNVARVFARVNLLTDDFKKDAPRKALADWLRPYIIESGNPGDFNQAMMELGALVCSPSTPHCQSCPLQDYCHAHLEANPLDYPFVAKSAPLPTRKRSVLLIYNTVGELLLQRHEGERLLAGFWELPDIENLPIHAQVSKRSSLYKQTFSHFHLQMKVHTAKAVEACELPEQFCWCAEPASLPLTTATRKILAQLHE